MRGLKMVGKVALWIVQIFAAAAFVAIGLGKFGSPEWAHKFARWGYPEWFYMVIGSLEAAGGILLLVPALASYAAALLGAILVGAAATLVLHHESRVRAPLLWLAVVVVIGWARRRRAWRSGVRQMPAPASQV